MSKIFSAVATFGLCLTLYFTTVEIQLVPAIISLVVGAVAFIIAGRTRRPFGRSDRW